MPTVFSSPDRLLDAVGQDLGSSPWVTIEQERIDGFADATGDHQWIHVDPEKAKNGPFEACIAHGYLTLSMVNMFLPEIIVVENLAMGVNVGCNKVRFPSPVRVGSNIRGCGQLISAEPKGGGIQAVIKVTIEIEGIDKPACVVETVSRYFSK